MSTEPKKNRPLCSRKESLLSRSCPPDETNVDNKSTQNDVFCVEVSDDSEHEVDTFPRISIQFRQNTETDPVDREMLKSLNTEFMNEGRRGSSRSSSDSSPAKKLKVSNDQPLSFKETLMKGLFNLADLPTFSDSEQEVIELESISSHNRNTRLKSSESSSEIRVSSSSKSTRRRPRLKNTVPADSFERYLSSISKKYRELTHRDRVILWEFSDEVSDVEDYTQFEEKLEKYKTTVKYITTARKTQLDNNNGEASSSTKNNCTTPTNELLAITCLATVDIESTSSTEEVVKEDILMSINTKTMEVYRHDPLLLDSDGSKKTGSPLNLVWSDESSGFKNSRLNPEIDKISRIIQSNLLKRGKEDAAQNHEYSNHENEENFKIPTIPRKYLPNKMDSFQKEEFYKYLGLGTKSPNGKCDDDHEHTDNIRRSRRLQMQQSPTSTNSSNDDKYDELTEDEISTQKNYRTSPIQSPVIDYMENHEKPKDNSTNKLLEKTSTPLKISKARRTCGPVVKSVCRDSLEEVKENPYSPKFVQQEQHTLNASKNSESAGEMESDSSTSTMVLMRHSYEKPGSSVREDGGATQPFCRDMTEKIEQNFSMRLRNGMIPVRYKKRNKKKAKLTNTTLLSESKVNNTASIIYNKFKEFKESLKESAVGKPSSILIKCDYSDNTTLQKTKKTEADQDGATTPLDFIHNSNSPMTCPVVIDKNEINDKTAVEQTSSIPKSFHRTVIRKRKNRTHWAKTQRVKLLRSSVLNQRILRNRKFVIITTKTLNKKSRPRMVRKRKRSPSEKSTNLLSPARVAKMDKADEDVVVKAPELEVQNMEISLDEENHATTEERMITKVEYASPNLLPNPLDSQKGVILHAFYIQDLLVVVQDLFISFWKYSKVVQMLGKPQEWEQLGECKRNLNDCEISAPYKNRLCLNETNPVYLEMRARQLPIDIARECNLASVYVNVYYFDEWKAAILNYSVQLDTIRGLATDVTYTTVTNSRYFIMCWKQESVLGTNRTGLCKYALTPDLDTLASIREFKHMRHIIHHLECINDDKLIGFGETQVTIWDHRTGDVLTNFDLEISLGRNVGSILSSIQFKSYLFLYQTRFVENSETPELKIVAITLSASTPSFRLIYTHELPSSFTSIKSSICTEDYVITTSGIGEEFLLLPHQPHRLYYFNPSLATTLMRFHSSGSQHFIEISNETLVIKTIDEYIMNFMK